VLRHKLGDDGIAALQQFIETVWEEKQRLALRQLTELEKGHQAMQAAIQALAEAQRRTEERVGQLAEAQRRTEERLNRLEAVVAELAEAQRRTEERVEQLAEAQRRTEERLNRLEAVVAELAEAQRRTEEQVASLVIAQRRTEKGLQELTQAVDALRKEVGGLSENIGFGLEGIARIVLPGYLERHLDVKVLGPLGEELNPCLLGPEGKEMEFDLYGVGLRNGKETAIVGEVKSRIYSDDVRRFLSRLEQVRPALPENIIPVLFGYVIHPRAQKEAEETDVLLVAAHQR